MIMINTCFVLSLPCKKMVKGKKIPTSVDIVDVPPPIYNDTEGEDVSVSAGTTQLSNEELYHLF